MEIKLISWNVNGIRAAVKNGFDNFLLTERPDIIGLQEIKISNEARAKETFDWTGYNEYWYPAQKPGYSGTAILTKIEPLSYREGIGVAEFDSEGRTQTMEFESFYFLNIYFPNAKDDLSRIDFKQKFNKVFLAYVKKLEKKKPVIACGDFNVAHEEIDIARPRDNRGHSGFTDEERGDMTTFLSSGLIDTYRFINKDKIEYSWWSYRFFARDKNIGWRIDYFLASEALKKNIKKAFILGEVFGSDHCPVGITLKI